MNVARDTPSGAVYNDLRALARQQGRPFDELLALHALDGFLARLASSEFADRLVLKGGVLLAAYDLRRPTRDVDLHAQELANDAATVLALVRSIVALPLNDGLEFDSSTSVVAVIRDEDEYSGVRVSLRALLARAEVPFHVDVSVGDPITPAPQQISLPRLLGDPVHLRGYPITMVHAEKLVTAIWRGTANTRWRDFGDIYSAAGRHPIDSDELSASLKSVARFRKVDLTPLSEVLDGYSTVAQPKYAAWRRNQSRVDLPERFELVLDRTIAFADPVLAGMVPNHRWDPVTLSWSV